MKKHISLITCPHKIVVREAALSRPYIRLNLRNPQGNVCILKFELSYPAKKVAKNTFLSNLYIFSVKDSYKKESVFKQNQLLSLCRFLIKNALKTVNSNISEEYRVLIPPSELNKLIKDALLAARAAEIIDFG